MISVIIPIYNVEKYVARCLDSVINQTYQDLEIIIVNDATPDNSMAIVEEYAAKDSRIRIVHNPRNMGLMMTRKNGYMVATGDYLTFVDSDDYLPKNAIEVMLAKAMETSADIVAGNYVCVKTSGEEILQEASLPYGGKPENVLKALLKEEFPHTMWAKLYKRELLQDHQYTTYDNMTNAEDVCLLYQLVNNASIVVCVSDTVYYYKVNLSSSTHVKISLTQIRSIIKANKIRLQVCSQYPLIRHLADSFVTKVLAGLHMVGHPRREVMQIIKEEGMEDYYKFFHVMRMLSFRELLSILKYDITSLVK